MSKIILALCLSSPAAFGAAARVMRVTGLQPGKYKLEKPTPGCESGALALEDEEDGAVTITLGRKRLITAVGRGRSQDRSGECLADGGGDYGEGFVWGETALRCPNSRTRERVEIQITEDGFTYVAQDGNKSIACTLIRTGDI